MIYVIMKSWVCLNNNSMLNRLLFTRNYDLRRTTTMIKMYGTRTNVQPIGENNFKEVQFPMPWGYIAGKWWGDQNCPTTLLAIHDWRQNAAAYDRIIPKLRVPGVLAIDLPGHGRSSHFPKATKVHPHDLLLGIRRILKQMPNLNCQLIGHGYGSTLAMIYASIYDLETTEVIIIESSLNVVSHLWDIFPTGATEALDFVLDLEKTPSLKPCTRSELINRLKVKLHNRISDESAALLVQRDTLDLENDLLQDRTDPTNAVYPFFKFNDDHMVELLKRNRSRCLSIWNMMDNYEYGRKENLQPDVSNAFFAKSRYEMIRLKGFENVLNNHRRALDTLRESCRYLEEHEVFSEHHILLDEGHCVVSECINHFFDNVNFTSEINL